MASLAFRLKVFAAVRRVGPGRIATYGDIAKAAGRPRAWRAVGSILRDCDDPHIPCHRIVAAGGRLGGYGSSPDLKAALLRAEGIPVSAGRIRDWRSHLANVEARRTPGGAARSHGSPKPLGKVFPRRERR
ncbi:MAG TPA: MGMT family protein [Vicinamibacterales bacterium]|nr:MGMT family protein [Vicinamibacterales bacterium]